MPSRLKKGFWERAGDRQERLIRRYEEHMAVPRIEFVGYLPARAQPLASWGKPQRERFFIQ